MALLIIGVMLLFIGIIISVVGLILFILSRHRIPSNLSISVPLAIIIIINYSNRFYEDCSTGASWYYTFPSGNSSGLKLIDSI